MRNDNEELSRVLHDLADVPGPSGLADRALATSKGMRRKRMALIGVAAAAIAGVLSLPSILLPLGGPGLMPAGGPGATANVQNGDEPCAQASSVKKDLKEVAEADWPQYVRTAVSKLPARTDYVMQSGTAGLCNGEAYSVINLGPMREHGHLTVTLQHKDKYIAGTCDTVVKVESGQVGPAALVLFCEENASGFQVVYAIYDGASSYRVNAVYPDGRVVSMESLADGANGVPEMTAEQLRVVVTAPEMAALFGN